MKRLLYLVLLCVVSCTTRYVIPQGKTIRDFRLAEKECKVVAGEKLDGVYIGSAAGDMYIGETIHNMIIDQRFQDCLVEKGYKVAE